MLSAAEHEALALRLLTAQRSGVGIDPPSDRLTYSMEDAYQVRRRFVGHLTALGDSPIGHKIGFTSETMRAMYGMSAPDFGILLASMLIEAGAPVPVSRLAHARAEPEIAFVLARPLTGPGLTIDDVLDATRVVRAAVEVIDSRVGAMRARAVDSIADNAGAGYVVLGRVELQPRDIDLSSVAMEFEVDGDRQVGHGADVMGHPAAPVAWLAGRLTELDGLGGRLEAGHIVISGAPTKSVAVHAGSHLHARFGPLGAIDIAFT